MQQITEVMTAQQRMKRAMIMARNRSKIERARERARARLADAKKIVERAMRMARQIVRTRVVGERGERYQDLSPAEKVEIDKVMQKRKDAIKKVALRLIQQVRKKEFERYKSFFMGKNLDHLHTHSEQVQDVGMLLNEMIDAAEHLILTEQQQNKLAELFGDHEDYPEYKKYFVESLALEGNNSDMALFRTKLLHDVDRMMLGLNENTDDSFFLLGESKTKVSEVGLPSVRHQRIVGYNPNIPRRVSRGAIRKKGTPTIYRRVVRRLDGTVKTLLPGSSTTKIKQALGPRQSVKLAMSGSGQGPSITKSDSSRRLASRRSRYRAIRGAT